MTVCMVFHQRAATHTCTMPVGVPVLWLVVSACFSPQVHLSSNFTSWWHDTHPDKDPSLTLGPLTLWSNSLPESEHDAGKGGKDGADADTQGLV